MKLRWIMAAVLAAQAGAAFAADNVIRIGVLNDQSDVFADNGRRDSVAAAKLAADDFGNELLGKKIEIIRPITRTSPISPRPPRANGSTMRAST